MAKTIAIFNQAGGVGKTTIAQNLGYEVAKGKRVLLIDLDSQGSLTTFVGLNPDELTLTIADSLIEKKPLVTHTLTENLAIIPANRNLRRAEIQLVGEMARESRLKRLLTPLQPQFDLILIDCPPSGSLLPILGLTAADWLLVPVQTHPKAFWGTDQLLATLIEIQESTNPNLTLLGIVPTLYDRCTTEDKEILAALCEQLGEVTTVFNPIPKAVAFPKASKAHLPLFIYQKNHPALAPLSSLAQGIISGLEKDQLKIHTHATTEESIPIAV
jgi:chromosome partitioning protein